jgi:predicted dienelactone hydrolase
MRCSSTLIFAALVGALAPAAGGCGDNLVPRSDPGKVGPYPVGVTTVSVTDPRRCNTFTNECPRRFSVEIWYPASEESAGMPEDELDILNDMPEAMRAALGDFRFEIRTQPAFRDAPVHSGGTFPVVLFSHGDTALRYQSYTYTSYIASHGYVVVAPDHAGNTIFEIPSLEDVDVEHAEAAVNRPRDLSFLLDLMESEELTGGRIEEIADLDRVAVTGHSFGGLTSLLITNPLMGFFDNRVDIAIPLAPVTSFLDELGAPININIAPTFYVAGAQDNVAPLETEARAGFLMQTSERGLAALDSVGHLSFADFCSDDINQAARLLGYPRYFWDWDWNGCGQRFHDPVATQERTGFFAVSWLQHYLEGYENYGRLLAPPFDGVEVVLEVD